MGFDFSQCGEVTTGNKAPMMGRGQRLCRVADLKFGPSDKPGSKNNVLKLTLEIVASSEPDEAPGTRRFVTATDKGDFGEARLAATLKEIAATLRGLAGNDTRLTCAKGDVARSQAIGQAIQGTLQAAANGELSNVEFAVVSEWALDGGGRPKLAADGSPYTNHTFAPAAPGWRPEVRQGAAAPAAPPPAPAPTALPSTQGVASPWDPTPAAAPAPQAAPPAPPAPPAAGGNFWDR